MRISVFGLGYVGTVCAACLAKEGHVVIGVDTLGEKVRLINDGKSPIAEQGLAELIEENVANGRLKAITKPNEAVFTTELSFICVGTPNESDGSVNMESIYRVCEDIGRAIKGKTGTHLVVCRSTMLPGSTRKLVIPTLEAISGKQAGENFRVCTNPEFMREGTAIHDFYHPPKIVIGEINSLDGDLLVDLYSMLDAPTIRTDIETSEMIKYADNAWHATKICFANEIGSVCKALGIDSHKVMDIFCQDTMLNISSCYLMPGFAFGGSCLPKDVRALNYIGQSLGLDLPILGSVMASNAHQIEQGLKMIESKRNRRIGIVGLSFKAGTDDLRESPLVEITIRLMRKGYNIVVYDQNVNLAKLIGRNRNYLLSRIPQINQLLIGSLDELLEHAQTIVVGQNSIECKGILRRLREDQVLVDLVRIDCQRNGSNNYDGIAW